MTMSVVRISQAMTDTILAAVKRESGEYIVRARVQTEVALMERGLIEFMDDYARLTVSGHWVLGYIKSGGKRRAWTTDEITMKMGPVTSAPKADAPTETSEKTRTAADFPKGTRVVDPAGRLGTVNGHDVGSVTDPGHTNYGREYIGVDWDAIENDMGCGRRGRPFVDELRIDIARRPDQFSVETVDGPDVKELVPGTLVDPYTWIRRGGRKTVETDRCGAMDPEDLDACGSCDDCNPAPRTELPHKVLAATAIQIRYTRERLASLTGLTRQQRAYVTELDECLRAAGDKIDQFK